MENQEQKPEQPITPQEQKFTSPKRSDGRPKWIVPVIVIVGIIVLGVGVWVGYNYWLKPAAPEEQPTQEQKPEDEFVDWRVYKNEKYGIEFKYPQEWDFQADPSISSPFYLRFSEYSKAPEVLGPDMYAITKTKSDLDTLRQSIESGETKEVIGETQEILWSTLKPLNLNGKVVRSITGFYAPGGSFYQMVQFFIEKDLIQLWVNLPLDHILQKDRDEDPGLTRRLIEQIIARQVDTEILETIDTFNQILSTFKFIEIEIVDCGEIDPDNPDQAEEVQGCFEVRFKECKPAKYIPSIDLGPLGGLVTYYYEIIGPEADFCTVKSRFIKNPNPDWVGKEMICEYDNSKDFEEAMQDISKCEGELYNLMNPMPKIMIYKGVSVTIPPLSLKVGFVRKEGENYIVSVEHIQESFCVKKEISLPTENSYNCKGITYVFQLYPSESNTNQVVFSVQ